MARSPSDATRFTATGPYAASSNSFAPNTTQSTSAGSRIDFGAPAPAGETPQQKIARLRAAAAAAKQGKDGGMDKVVAFGRVWADRAHRFTTLGLIGLTVISGMVAMAGVTDMILHNRRRRTEFFAQKQAESAVELAEARKAYAEGTATEHQILVLNRDRIAFEMEQAKRNQPGVLTRTKNRVFGEEASTSSIPKFSGEELLGEKEDRGVLKAVEEKVAANRRTGEQLEEAISPQGGPLDVEAEKVASTLSTTGKSWTSWITGR